MSQLKNLKRWIGRVNDSASSDTVIVDALMKIRPYSKRKSGIKDIEESEGIKCFLKLIQRPNKRILDISISLLANCLTEESTRKKVFSDQGIPHIVKLLQTIRQNTILTRACRSIANLAYDIDCSKTIHAIGTVQLLLQLIKKPSTPLECLTSAFRAIKNLANTPAHRKKLIQQGMVAVIVNSFDSAYQDVTSVALHALTAISQACSLEFADHMLGNDGFSIRKLVNVIEEHPESRSTENALSVLVNLTLQGCTRPTIGSVGGLKCIVNEIKLIMHVKEDGSDAVVHGPLPENSFRLAGALCYCCREAINRARLRSMEALPIFIQLLSDNRWKIMHPFILTTLLCFVYDQEGLKTLHDNGIFAILLDKLQEYTNLEKDTFKKSSKKQVWDGHDIDNDEDFDRRHSLSSDIPTKFNQRPQMPVQDIPGDMETTFRALTELDFAWRYKEEVPPYSPQWSPAGPSPVPAELAFAHDSSPPDTPRAISPSDLHDQESRDGAADNNAVADVPDIVGEPVLDQDDSSSSREGFDQMHFPALLPLTGDLNMFPDNLDTPSTSKRDRLSSSGSDGSNKATNNMSKGNKDEMDFETRMQKDLRQAPKRARIDNVKDSGDSDRVRSRSYDTAGETRKSTIVVENQAPSSPSPEDILPDMGDTVCSPRFLRFVNETCSVSSQLLKSSDVASGSSATPTSTSVRKQPKRRISGASRKLDESTAGDSASEKPETEPKEETTPQLQKTSSNPLPLGEKMRTSTDQVDDSALVDAEPITEVQVILCLLCHYCEVSDNYIVSLALQDQCTEALASYMAEYPKSLDAKFERIVDKLTGCTKCFSKIVSSLFAPRLSSTAVLRTPFSNIEQENICDHCGFDKSSDCASLMNNVWHNIAISHSSSYGSHLLKTSLTKGTDLEAAASMCVVLLLFLWYWEENEVKSMSDGLYKRLLSNLHAILDENKLELLLAMVRDNCHTSEIFGCVSHAFHKFARITWKRLELKHRPAQLEESEEHSTLQENKKQSTSPKDASGEIYCAYEVHCKSSKPERELVFSSKASVSSPEVVKQHPSKNKKKPRKRRSPVQLKDDCQTFAVHAEVLSAKSPMFEAMLQGKYRESSEKSVKMQDVSYEAASYILHGMYGCNSEDCTTMRRIIEAAYDDATSGYEKFCQLQNGTSFGYPVELDILKMMDLWLLPDAKKEFYDKHKKLFGENYITVEIEKFLENIKSENSSNVKELSEVADSAHVTANSDSPSSCSNLLEKEPSLNHCFWDFLISHAIDATQDYIKYFCSPCLFQHNHLHHGQVFSFACAFASYHFFKIFVENLSETYSELLRQFKVLRKSD